MTEKEAKILAMQSPSMQKLMRIDLGCPTKEDIAWKEAPFDAKKAVVRDKDGNVDVGMRALSGAAIENYEKLRYARGGYIAEMRKEPAPSSVTKPKKNRAIAAFMAAIDPTPIKEKFKELTKGLMEVSIVERIRIELFGEKNEN